MTDMKDSEAEVLRLEEKAVNFRKEQMYSEAQVYDSQASLMRQRLSMKPLHPKPNVDYVDIVLGDGRFRTDLLAAGFRAFTEDDWNGFMGCQSKQPWIRDDKDTHLILLDGTTVSTFIVTDPEKDYTQAEVFNVEFTELTDSVAFAILLTKQNTSYII